MTMMPSDNGYHYTECGLDYVFLTNGYELSADGRQVAIKDVEGLYDAIGRFIIHNRKRLSGREIRFLRHELSMSQETLAKLLDVSEQTVHRWETGKTVDVPSTAEALIRFMYLDRMNEHSNTKARLKRIADLEDAIDQHLMLCETNGNWAQAEPAEAA